jgi:two-component system NarL family sensor kinase
MRVVEEERAGLAGHLHGELEPIVISTKLQIEDAAHRLQSGSTDDALQMLGEIAPRLRALAEDLRSTANDLRPKLLDELRLLASLEWLGDRFAASHPNIGVVRRLTAREEEVPRAWKLDIFRIAQEALRNVGEDTGASWVRLCLFQDGDALNFQVEDNGAGLVAAKSLAAESRAGIGLALMRRRAAATGGRLTLKSLARQGSQLKVVWRAARRTVAADDPGESPTDIVSD